MKLISRALVLTLLPGILWAFPIISEPLLYYGNLGQTAFYENYAFMGTEYGLVVYDLTDPAHPVFLNRREGKRITDLQISDGVLYCLGDEYLEISLVHPAALRVNSELSTPGLNGLVVHNNRIGMFNVTSSQVGHEFEFNTSLMFLHRGTPPTISEAFCQNYWFQSYDFNDNFLYQGNGPLVIWNIANPDSAYQVNAVDRWHDQIALHNGRLFTSSYDEPFKIWSIENPVEPELIGEAPDEANVTDFTISGDFLFGRLDSNFVIYDVTHPANMTPLSSYQVEHSFRDVAVSERVAALSGDWCTEFVDIADKAYPQHLSSLINDGRFQRVMTQDTIVVITSELGGIYVFSTANPNAPDLISHFQTGLFATSTVITNNVAYITASGSINDEEAGTFVMEISDTNCPWTITRLPECNSMAIYQNILYLASDSGLSVYDVRYPREPCIRTRIDSGPIDNLELEYPYLIERTWGQQVCFYDISRPSEPQRFRINDRFRNTSYLDGIVVGDILLQQVEFGDVPRGERALYELVYDISDRQNIRLLDSAFADGANYIRIGPFIGKKLLDTIKCYDYINYAVDGKARWVSNILDDLRDTNAWTNSTVLVDSTLYGLSNRRMALYDLSGFVSVPNAEPHSTPNSLILEPPYPNPFNSSTTISYSVPTAGRYFLTVTDITGREVARLVNAWRAAGSYREVWDGGSVASGFYNLRLSSDEVSVTKSVQLVK